MLGRAVAVLMGLVVIASGCGGSSEPVAAPTTAPPPPKLSVVATTTHIGDFIKVLAGDAVDLKVIGGSGVDPHTYIPSADDVTSLATADVIFRNGAGLEKWFEQSYDESQGTGVVVDTSLGVELREVEIDGVTATDPHIWMSPINARIMVANIANSLAELDSTRANIYRSSERAYYSQLDALRRNIERSFSALRNDSLVTEHRSFDYFTDEFDLEYLGSANPNLETEIGGRTTDTGLAALIRTANVPVFAEAGSRSRAAQNLANAAGVSLVTGTAALYSDSLGAEGSKASTYLEMMQHNATTIVNNLE